jgi:hypothetical protein
MTNLRASSLFTARLFSKSTLLPMMASVTLFPSWLRSSFTQFFTLTKELLSVMSYTSSAPGRGMQR